MCKLQRPIPWVELLGAKNPCTYWIEKSEGATDGHNICRREKYPLPTTRISTPDRPVRCLIAISTVLKNTYVVQSVTYVSVGR